MLISGKYRRSIAHNGERVRRNEYKCVVYDERSPEGTEVWNKCHKRNDIQFILPIVCFYRSFCVSVVVPGIQY